MKHENRFLVVGLGLMGGSYAMGLSQKGYQVDAIDINPASLEWAQQNGLIQHWALQDTPQAEALTTQADYILLSLYPKDILPWLEAYHTFFKPGALITDLAGVKGLFVHQAQELLEPSHEFIPSHPMAGREVGGVQNADPLIFQGANFLIIPTEKNTPQGIQFAQTLAQELEFGQVTLLSVEEHDRMIGYVSQLTHAIAVSLMNANNDPQLPRVTGDSFRDLTRIADINPELWSELFLSNAPTLVEEIDTFTKCLNELRGCLVQQDSEKLKALFRSSGVRRRQFGKSQKQK